MSKKNSSYEPTIPVHVGVIMDGNGRWAQEKGLTRSKGHKEGLKAAKRITKAAVHLGVKYLSLYVFSTENWKRTEEEVSFLMIMIKEHLKKEFEFYKKNNIRVTYSGDLEGLPEGIRQEILDVQEETKLFSAMTVNLAINYGGQDEIIRAVKKWDQNLPKEPLTIEVLESYLDSPQIPPLDLIIRTAGELRLSNFMLWRSAYAEFYFSPKYWPDWDETDFSAAIEDYQKRQRKFGAVHG